ncbi:DUF1360 domain-containing protein [Rhodococcus chondri]|uniref:DUF1360 domain-containing protein n=1 Tax=Rhodococcus chondri TaxID=3065941 RepID=A0ABU7JVS9_9NOCA|nr:DUF1360 domain-containing protein [Rhodococcus sp. CC-R104]MEE2034133.1 DUF1360 domain-containing protein [Rhodococcus sp. CC-R104]
MGLHEASSAEQDSAERSVVDTMQQEADIYRNGEDRPVGGYAVVMAVYLSLVGVLAGVAAKLGRPLPRPTAGDIAVTALASHKVSRVLSKAAVTSPVRAPFTRFDGPGGPAEVMEKPRESSRVRHAIGELLACPFCLDLWVVTALVFGLVYAPGVTRLIAGSFCALTGADFLHLAYAKAQQMATEG